MSLAFLLSILLFVIIKTDRPALSYLPGTHLLYKFEDYLEKSNMTMFVFYYNPNSMQCIGLSAILPQVMTKLKKYVEFVFIDCSLSGHKKTKGCQEGIIPDFELHSDDSDEADDEEEEDEEDQPKNKNKLEPNFYKLELYVPVDSSTVTDPNEKTIYRKNNYQLQGSIAEAPITKFISNLIISRATKITFQNFNKFLQDFSNINKILLITKKKKTPLIFKGLSNFYFGKIAFGEIHESESLLLGKLGVTSIPSLVMYQNFDESGKLLPKENIIFYEGEQTAEEISKFLDKYIVYVNYDNKEEKIEEVNDL